MFDLEQSIADWRRQMFAAGIKTPVPLDELENHLREEIERQIQSGTNPQRAFENSVQQIGHADELKGEFKKICGSKWNAESWRQLVKIGGIGLGGTVILNLLGRFVFHRNSSVYFSDEWWSAWLPNYIVWTSFIIIGLSLALADWRSRHKATKQ